MKTTPRTSGARRARPLLAALFLVTLLASPVRAEGGASAKAWAPIQWAMGNQRRMLQTATVGMCLALYIIMWRK
jgi:hypothetical protein